MPETMHRKNAARSFAPPPDRTRRAEKKKKRNSGDTI